MHCYGRLQKRNRKEKEIFHRQFLLSVRKRYPCVTVPVNQYGNYNHDDPVGTIWYKRVWYYSRRMKHIKRDANRVVRRKNKEVFNRAEHKRLYSKYWWL